MTRVKRSVAAGKRKKNVLKRAKGFLNSASTKFRAAKEQLLRSEFNQYKSRRLIKRDMRSLWITRINGALDQIGEEMNYSTFIHKLTVSKIELNRKSISEMAIKDIEAFKALVSKIK
jgi:large subunit ribosomal protein L20